MLAITFDRATFEQAIASTPRPEALERVLRQPVLKIPITRLGECRERLMSFFDHALFSASEHAIDMEPWLEAALISEMIGLLTDPECDKDQRHGSSSGSYIVEKCHQLTMIDRLNPPSVSDICQRLRVSRRSVQNGFRNVTDTTPINYIRCVRLNGVRRELMTTSSVHVSIGDAAARWGFFHLSHFASDYQELFGELPSQTLRSDGVAGRPGGKAAVLAA